MIKIAMITNDLDRLNRIEALLEWSIITSSCSGRAVEALVQSNARSIETIGTQFEDTKRLADRVFQRMESPTQQLAAMVSSRNEDRDLL